MFAHVLNSLFFRYEVSPSNNDCFWECFNLFLTMVRGEESVPARVRRAQFVEHLLEMLRRRGEDERTVRAMAVEAYKLVCARMERREITTINPKVNPSSANVEDYLYALANQYMITDIEMDKVLSPMYRVLFQVHVLDDEGEAERGPTPAGGCMHEACFLLQHCLHYTYLERRTHPHAVTVAAQEGQVVLRSKQHRLGVEERRRIQAEAAEAAPAAEEEARARQEQEAQDEALARALQAEEERPPARPAEVPQPTATPPFATVPLSQFRAARLKQADGHPHVCRRVIRNSEVLGEIDFVDNGCLVVVDLSIKLQNPLYAAARRRKDDGTFGLLFAVRRDNIV